MKSKLKLRMDKSYEPIVCPYADNINRKCTRKGCLRLAGYRCKYYIETCRKRAKINKRKKVTDYGKD